MEISICASFHMKLIIHHNNPVHFSEKALIERALGLRAELENAASDISNLFAKIGLYLPET